jgi:casein kinase II subunit beta
LNSFIEVYQSALDLYGLIHCRYILTSRGLHKIKNKFLNAEFGYCPRVMCERQIVLPIAMSEDLSISRVKVFCPKCEEVYVPRNRFVDIDGAYFGCSLPNIFFQTFPELIPKEKPIKYTPKIYGFKIFGMEGSKYEKNKNLNI